MFEEILNNEHKLYITEFPDGTSVIYRLLTINEYKKLELLKDRLKIDNSMFYEEVFNFCALNAFKNLPANSKAGIYSSIGEYIYNYSFNFDQIEDEIELTRLKVNASQFLEELKNTIILVYPNYLLSDLDNLSRLELIELFIKAENLLSIKSNGKYEKVNTKTLRKKTKSNKMDIDKERDELKKAGY